MTVSGFTAAGFSAVRDAFAQNFADGLEQGASFAAWLGDELIVDLRGGFADRAGTRAWDERTLCPVYSATKPVGALIVARLVERGALDYDAPVADYWPEFAANGKGAITIAEALSHQGGLPGFPDPIDPALWLDPVALAAELAKLPPMWGRGEGSGYHPLTWGYIADELVRRVSPRSLGTILREDICVPLDIDFWIGLPESEHGRVAELLKPKAAAEFPHRNAETRAAFLTPWAAAPRGSQPPVTLSAAAGESIEIRFVKSGRTLTWSGQDASLLDFAERNGLAVESGCRSGSCGSCETRLVSGEVHYAATPDHDIAQGHCLLCVGTPISPLVLDA